MAFEPLMHTEKMFDLLRGKLVKITINLSGKPYTYMDLMQSANGNFIILKNRQGKRSFLKTSTIVKILRLET